MKTVCARGPYEVNFYNSFAPLSDADATPKDEISALKTAKVPAKDATEVKEQKKKASKTENPMELPPLQDDEVDSIDNEVEFPTKLIKDKGDAMAAAMMRKSGICGTSDGVGILTYGSQGEFGHLDY